MEHQDNDLWQGGPWEQPAPVFPVPPPVVVPRQKRKKCRRGRRWIAFALTLVLIGSLTGAAVLLQNWLAPGEDTGEPASRQELAQYAPEGGFLPQAETGTGVTVTIAPLPEQTLSYTQVYEKNEQSIVTIHVIDEEGMSQGTGIVLTEDGYIITNAHVVDGAWQAVVVLNDDMDYQASLVGSCA